MSGASQTAALVEVTLAKDPDPADDGLWIRDSDREITGVIELDGRCCVALEEGAVYFNIDIDALVSTGDARLSEIAFGRSKTPSPEHANAGIRHFRSSPRAGVTLLFSVDVGRLVRLAEGAVRSPGEPLH